MKRAWERQPGKYQTGEWLRVGKVIVGSAFYDGTGPRTDPKKYAAECLLPGIKRAAERYETIEQAKARLERMVDTWFSWVEKDNKA